MSTFPFLSNSFALQSQSLFLFAFFLEIYHYFNPKPSAVCPNCFSVFSVASGNLILSSYGRIFPEQNILLFQSGLATLPSHPSVSPLGWVPGARSPFLNFHPHFGRIYPLVTSWVRRTWLVFSEFVHLEFLFQFMLAGSFCGCKILRINSPSEK